MPMCGRLVSSEQRVALVFGADCAELPVLCSLLVKGLSNLVEKARKGEVHKPTIVE